MKVNIYKISLWRDLNDFCWLCTDVPWTSQLYSHGFLTRQNQQREESVTSSSRDKSRRLGSCSQNQCDAFALTSSCLYFNPAHLKHPLLPASLTQTTRTCAVIFRHSPCQARELRAGWDHKAHQKAWASREPAMHKQLHLWGCQYIAFH